MGDDAAHDACCAPASQRGAPIGVPALLSIGRRSPDAPGIHDVEQIAVPDGTFLMGDSYGDGRPGDGETLIHEVELGAFSIDATSVTNAAFKAFVEATGYRTEAETFGDSAVFYLAVDADPADVLGRSPAVPWWMSVRGADWAHPNGPRSDIDGIEDHPVTHVTWNDAQAYCRWAQRRLPTEAEWERASRGALVGARYPWGDELLADDGTWLCNIWQGSFPRVNTEEDGWLTTAPVRSYQPNSFGLWQTVGNVWEWCADRFAVEYYGVATRDNPTGPDAGESRVLRGGSYLCHDSYCNRYRNAARSSNTPDSSMGNAGFRTVGVA